MSRTSRFRRSIDTGIRRTGQASDRVLDDKLLPAWRKATTGEPRWPVTITVFGALAMQYSLPEQVQLHHRWILPAIGMVLVIALEIARPQKLTEVSPTIRVLGLLMLASLGIANVVSGTRLVAELLDGTFRGTPARLLLTGGAIWLTNVIVFGLLYWELDRGGPLARQLGSDRFPDFAFVQMTDPELAPPDWSAGFVDYFYLSFTNASAFSPTDVLPMTRWAKLTMMLQSAVSLITVALVVARAVNILK
ncbi:MAG TPA: hypothetical protein VGO03_12160 [Acidimicrobiia bacterium]|jgi:hypothetical protein